MPLRITNDGRHNCPTVFCDHCNEVIRTARDGNYQWRHGEEELFFTHKKCCRAFQQARPGTWLFTPLEALPGYLAANLGVRPEESRKVGELCARV
jgi:hypothetical protein